MRYPFSLLVLFILPVCSILAADKPADKVQYDFEAPADLSAWSNLELPDAKDREPPAKLELSADHATSGQHSLKITFAGGQWPTITTTQILDDWLPYQTFRADVTVSRPCVVGFTALQEKGKRGEGWDALISRWTHTTFLQTGTNHVQGSLPQPNEYAISAKWGKVVRFEIFMYNPREGESIYVDNIRLGKDKVRPKETKATFAIQGTDWTVSTTSPAEPSVRACRELLRNVAHLWNKPTATTLEQIEKEFRAQYDRLPKKRFPKAALAIFREGQAGYDPAQPDKVYAGWKDAYWTSHGPDGNYAERARNQGKSATHEIFMRHRSPLMRVDLASIPTGSNILTARLLIVRAKETLSDDHNTTKHPAMWVAQPCNRPWEEYEVNAFQYARHKFWKAVGGSNGGEDPDFSPIFLAYGFGRPGKVNTWDFTEAVRYWTDGKHENHGFMLHNDYGDYMTAYAREAAEIRNRPALLVIYAPK